jgi:D-serine deaminase-like pyridoxal phosphate-dependent protein
VTHVDRVLDARFRTAVAALGERPISVCDKGFGVVAPVTAASLAERRPGLFSGTFAMPLLVLRDTALRHNVEGMAAYCAAAGVDLAPHGKTTMAPQLFARQLAAGAWGMTAATVGHMQTYRAFGISRILLANELTDPAGIAWLAAELAADPGFDCYVNADSLPGVRLLDQALRSRPGRPLPILVELGQPGGRTGCRTVEEAVTVAKAVAAAGSLRLAGAAGFEGTIGHDCTPGTPGTPGTPATPATPATIGRIASFCRDLRGLGELLRGLAAGPERLILSAGGSAYFDVVVRELSPGDQQPRVVLRSGAYVAHDHGLYASLAPSGSREARGAPAESGQTQRTPAEPRRTQDAATGPSPTGRTGPDLVPALELWAQVLSRPEPGLALLCAGRRDVSFDQGFPVPLRVRSADGRLASAHDMQVTKLDDQHAYLSVPADSELAPGDLICLGISHPCTTFDKWRVIPVVDDRYRVIDAVHTFF